MKSDMNVYSSRAAGDIGFNNIEMSIVMTGVSIMFWLSFSEMYPDMKRLLWWLINQITLILEL